MKKGFTLIELLAVIVILAIMALIATPIVLNIIEESRDNSNLRSAEYYLDAVELGMIRRITKESIPNGTYNILENGNICLEYEDTICKDELVVEVKGKTPEEGVITIKNSQIISSVIILNDKKMVMNSKGQQAYPKAPKSFEEDDWETIALNVKAGNISKYKVGDTKEVKLTGFTNEEKDSDGNNMVTYTVRIANTSTPEECSTSGFSQTACGFVIEFVDIITNHHMNPATEDYSGGHSLGGWRDSAMRTYVNRNIYNSFPLELKENIIDTYVVSGHELGATQNYKTTDKIYLLSTQEVWEQGTCNPINEDTARELTRQLDYYKIKGVTTDNYSGAIKKSNGSALEWWLRSPFSHSASSFYGVNFNGDWVNIPAYGTIGVAVAFRLG